MKSQERCVDDSELSDEEESHIDPLNKNYISKGKDTKTIDSINKNIRGTNQKLQWKPSQKVDPKNNRYQKSRSPVSNCRDVDRKSSISLLMKPKKSIVENVEINIMPCPLKDHTKNTKSFISVDNMIKPCGLTSQRTLSNSRLHERTKSIPQKSRHFRMKHTSNNMQSMETFQKLISNFPDIRCSSTENVKAVDRESIDRKASELIKYMSSGKMRGFKNCKSSRENRDLSYGNESQIEKMLNSAFSDSKVDKGFMHKTSILIGGEAIVREPMSSLHCRRMSGIKYSAWQLNKILPSQKVGQIPDMPSIDFDLNECTEEDINLSSVSEEIIIEQESLEQ